MENKPFIQPLEQVACGIILDEGAVVPEYATCNASGADVRAFIKEPYVLGPHETHMFPTGIRLDIPWGFEVQVRSRSGLSAKHGIIVSQGVGTIDGDYQGECRVCLTNTSNEPYTVQPGERIGQFVLEGGASGNKKQADWQIQTGFTKVTERSEGGFGSTGKM